VAGLVALIVLVTIDAVSHHWNPEPWSYIGGVTIIVGAPRGWPAGRR
jgi:hypothetical protein